MILVTGATGNIGTELVKQLRTEGARMRVITRDEIKVSHLDGSVERVIVTIPRLFVKPCKASIKCSCSQSYWIRIMTRTDY